MTDKDDCPLRRAGVVCGYSVTTRRDSSPGPKGIMQRYSLQTESYADEQLKHNSQIMISLFHPVSMATERYAAGPELCLGVLFASNITILRKLAIYSDSQAKEKNGHF